jgi:hypothetical protein
MDPSRRRDSARARRARSPQASARSGRTGDVTRPEEAVKRCGQPDIESLRTKLSIAVSVVNVCVAALEAQAAHRDLDAAEALQRCVSDVLWEQIERLDRLIIEGPA